MPSPIIPFMPSNIPSELQQELNRRKVNRSFKFLPNGAANWDFSGTGPTGQNDWISYRGPMVSWVRVCSNGYGRRYKDSANDNPRFVFYGGKGFYQTYGFEPLSKASGQQIIGYSPSTNPSTKRAHILENSLNTQADDALGNPQNGNFPIHVPTPEISRLEIVIQKELYRRATMEWVCFSWKQLEYMAPYFLVPGISVMMEWGWNHFNVGSLVDLSNVDGKEPNMRSLWNNSYPLYTDNILKSKGNYDVVYGIITNFNWSIEGNKIICSTEITSKDRLYAGIAKDTSLKIKKEGKDEPPGWLLSIKKFVESTDVMYNLNVLASSKDPITEAQIFSKSRNSQSGSVQISTGGKTVDNQVWTDLVNRCLPISDPKKTVKGAFLHGIFAGRSIADPDLYKQSQPKGKDFDSADHPRPETFWINMGMIVEILNYFSTRPGVNQQPMFEVDITSAIIGAHPNLISCDRRVLIPNYQAPKYHYGLVGITNNAAKNPSSTPTSVITETGNVGFGVNTPGFFNNTAPNSSPANYFNQFVGNGKTSDNPADDIIGKTFYQFKASSNKVFRNDLDRWINWYRYHRQYDGKSSYSFPAQQTTQIPSNNGNITIEKDYSGLLSNIYISYQTFIDIITKDGVNSYFDIYKAILDVIMDSSDEYWDLALTEAEGKMTVVDRKYINKSNIDKQNGDPVWTFDYYDSDSLIKSFRFRPALTDAQATRAIYGSTNNPNSKFSYDDKYDILSYKFKDAVILPESPNISQQSPNSADINKTYFDQLRAMVGQLQNIDDRDDTIQMTVPPTGHISDSDVGKLEVIKLVMPDQELLRMILHDEDKKNNQIYSAIQPGITAEITMLGIGGIRTFQYFLVRNLPEPYSHRNVVFRVTDVQQTVEAGNWETTIRAGLIPLTDYVKDRIGYPKDQKTI